MSILPSMLQRKVQLTITTEDHATEIFVIDGEFQLVERGVGELRVSLARGIYNIKLRAGVQTAEQLVVLMGDKAEETLHLDAFEFSSAAPLEKTGKTHEFHMDAARELARTVDVSVGKGSWIYVFARDWTSKERPKEPGQIYNPIRGLSLLSMDGDFVSSLYTDVASAPDWDPCAGRNVEVAPGAYRLRLELPGGGGKVERTVIASPGWQTQIFLLQADYGRGPESREADLSRGSVFLSPTPSFDPADPSYRLTELARLALASGRHRISAELRNMLGQSIESPMLGIYGAHLLLLDPQPDHGLLKEVVAQLRSRLGTHPDVEAIALKLPEPKTGDYLFKSPPMLRRSWTCIVAATCSRPELVPAESLAGRISTRLWGDGSWLAWVTPPAGPAEQEAEEKAERSTRNVITEALAAQLQHLRETAGAEKLTPSSLSSAFERFGHYLKDTTGSLYETLMELLRTIPSPKENQESKEAAVEGGAGVQSEGEPEPPPESQTSSAPTGAGSLLDDETAAKLVRAFGLPRAQIEKLLGDIKEKL